MALYSEQDIAVSISGDILTNRKGDLDLSNSLDTYKSAISFVVRTDYGDYSPNQYVGCNLGAYIGEVNNRVTHDKMTRSINVSIGRILSSEDFTTVVAPFDVNEAIGLVYAAGIYLIDNEYRAFEEERLTFLFPYIEGREVQVL